MTAPADPDNETDIDNLDFEPVARPYVQKKRWWLRILVSVVLLSGGGGAAAWLLLSDGMQPDDPYDVPLVKAQENPVKIRPDKPGGLEVANRDKLVYGRLQGNGAGPKVEQLLPRPETPLPPPIMEPAKPSASAPHGDEATKAAAAPVTPKSLLPPATHSKRMRKPAPPPALAKPPVMAKPMPAPAYVTKPAPVAKAAPKMLAPKMPAPKMAARTPAPAPRTSRSTSSRTAPSMAVKGSYVVQLAAGRNKTGIAREWVRLRDKNTDLLGSFTLFVQRADLGAKGIYYRLRVGPIADETSARSLCAALKGRKINCLPVRLP